MRTRTGRLMALGLACLSVIVGCGADDEAESTVAGSETPQTTEAPATTAGSVATTDASETAGTTETTGGPQKLSFGALQPGTYVGDRFEQPVTLTVGDGWQADETSKILVLGEIPPDNSMQGGSLGIIDVLADLSVEDLAAELGEVEGISFSAPEPTTITGLDGVVLTAEPPSEEVVYTFMQPSEGVWFTAPGFRSEVHVVDAPTGTRLIWIEAPADQWETFRPTVQSVIDSIVWEE